MSTMKPVNRQTAAILNKLTQGLHDPALDGALSSRKYDNAPDVYMPLCVECIGRDLYSLAHYGEQNGDLMRDPEMVFYRAPLPDGRWYPVSFRNDYAGAFRACVEFADDGRTPARFYPREQREQADFARMWMANVREQQGV